MGRNQLFRIRLERNRSESFLIKLHLVCIEAANALNQTSGHVQAFKYSV